MLDYPDHIRYLEALSGQFYGCQLVVSGSRMMADGSVVHYEKARAVIPDSSADASLLSSFLLTVLSLQVR